MKYSNLTAAPFGCYTGKRKAECTGACRGSCSAGVTLTAWLAALVRQNGIKQSAVDAVQASMMKVISCTGRLWRCGSVCLVQNIRARCHP